MDLLKDLLPGDADFEKLRDKLIIETFYQTGVRLAELLSMKEEDLDIHSRQLRVTGKRKKERVIPFSPEYGNLMKEYLRRKKLEKFGRSEEHTSELQSLMRISYAVFCL